MNCICKAIFEETLSWVVEYAVGHPCEPPPPPQCVLPGRCSCEALQKRPFGYYQKTSTNDQHHLIFIASR
jgi:hypothetical protein